MPLQEYTCTPRPRLHLAYLGVLGGVMLAVALWLAMSMWDVPYPLLWFAASLFSLTGVLLLTTRTLLWRFVYRIGATEDGGFDFIVLQTRGYGASRVCRCVCRVAVEQLCALTPEPRRGRVRTDYRWCVLPQKDACVLTLEDGEERVSARIAPDATLRRMLESYLQARP